MSPTGYTYAVQNGEVTELRDFAFRCARAMGFLITMRDDPMDAPIPEQLEPSTKYHDEALERARRELAWLSSLNEDEIELATKDEYRRREKSRKDSNRKTQLEQSRYQAMLSKVEAWKPPRELDEMRDFMLEQLRGSMKFDCFSMEPVPVLNALEWHRGAVEKASKDIAYHEAERAKEIHRTRERNRYLGLLRQAFPVSKPCPASKTQNSDNEIK